MVASTGMPWDRVEDELDIPRLAAMNEHWRKHPPVHIMVAAYLGYEPKAQKRESVNSPEEIEKLIAMMGGIQGG